MSITLSYPSGGMLVTGGSGRVGRGIVRRIAEAGVPLVFTYRDSKVFSEGFEAELRDAGHAVRAIAMDMTDGASIQRALDLVVSEFGDIHGVACGAGEVVQFNRIADFSIEQLERFIDRDALGYYRVFHAAIPMLRARGGGSITACTTIATRRVVAYDGMSPFSKGAVDALVRQVAAEEAQHGIRCNAIGMGWVEERTADEARAQHPMPASEPTDEAGRIDALMNQFFGIAKLGRPVTPSEAGDTYAFFASDQARHLTGQFVYLDAGILL
ncbi:MAG: SDR family NAD(P)-dependent oxidoreductase [Sphingobium sp.]